MAIRRPLIAGLNLRVQLESICIGVEKEISFKLAIVRDGGEPTVE